MKTWLLTWNPKKWNWPDLGLTARRTRQHVRFADQWSCAQNKSIRPGDRIFLIKLGTEPRGIIGAGQATSKPFWDGPWEGKPNDKQTRYVALEWDSLLDATQNPLSIFLLKKSPLSKMHWSPQASGITISPEIASSLESIWDRHYRRVSKSIPRQLSLKNKVKGHEQIDEELFAFEGTVQNQFVKHRRRESRLRDQKIIDALRAGNLKCEVPGCGFDFERVYGSIGAGFAEVHHRRGLARSGPTKTKLTDLAIVCANCHRMIHRGGKCRHLDTIIPRAKRGKRK